MSSSSIPLRIGSISVGVALIQPLIIFIHSGEQYSATEKQRPSGDVRKLVKSVPHLHQVSLKLSRAEVFEEVFIGCCL